jgi:Taurine catabolism dioxygenase TauD, TfdA family
MRTQACIVLEGAVPGVPGTPTLERAVRGPKAWTRDSIAPADWTVPLPPAALAEIAAMAEALRRDPLPTLVLTPALFRLQACRAAMERVRSLMREGVGLAVVDRLPLDGLSEDEARSVYWVLGQFVERLVAQKWDGSMLYDVTDTGREYGYGVRASWTNVELFFHTDNAFAVAPPWYVSLLCLHPAQAGGISRFCSLYTVHNRLLERYPRLLRRLYEPFYFDRQAEHAPGAPKVSITPAFACDGERLRARLSSSLIRRGYKLMEEPLDPLGAEALAALDEVMHDDDLWVEFTIERGQLQYINNLEFAHFRSNFQDHEDPARRRHLVRLWYRGEGRPSYDG